MGGLELWRQSRYGDHWRTGELLLLGRPCIQGVGEKTVMEKNDIWGMGILVGGSAFWGMRVLKSRDLVCWAGLSGLQIWGN